MTDLLWLIEQANSEETENLSKILDCDKTSKSIFDAFQWHSLHKLVYLVSGDKTYYTLLKQVAKNCKVSFQDGESEDMIETKLLETVFKQAWNAMTQQQRENLEEEIKKSFLRSGKEYKTTGSLAAVIAILSAQQSGFGIYILSSIALSTVSKAFGLSLGFASYVIASRAIAFITGPAGWAISGALLLISIGGSNRKKMLLGILQLIMVKARLNNINVPNSSTDSQN